MSYSTYPPICGTFTYGEVEDYTANITDGGCPTPVADFTADNTNITEGQSVNFTDLSTNTPDAWDWVFNGGTPGSSTVQNPTVTYNTAGTVTFKSSKTKVSSGSFTIIVDNVTHATLPYNPALNNETSDTVSF